MSNRLQRRSLSVITNDAPISLTKRSCGTCQECCTRLSVEGVKKESCVCKHQNVGSERGCSIEHNKPEMCFEYFCGYLTGVVGTNVLDRPDNSGLMFSLRVPNFDEPSIPVYYLVHELRENAREESKHLFDQIVPLWVCVIIKFDGKREILYRKELHSVIQKYVKNKGFQDG